MYFVFLLECGCHDDRSSQHALYHSATSLVEFKHFVFIALGTHDLLLNWCYISPLPSIILLPEILEVLNVSTVIQTKKEINYIVGMVITPWAGILEGLLTLVSD